ncbi:MAG: hypothetical protein WC967_13650 [Balneolaceae bacterium]
MKRLEALVWFLGASILAYLAPKGSIFEFLEMCVAVGSAIEYGYYIIKGEK